MQCLKMLKKSFSQNNKYIKSFFIVKPYYPMLSHNYPCCSYSGRMGQVKKLELLDCDAAGVNGDAGQFSNSSVIK